MKKIFVIAVTLILATHNHAQNVGIGTTTPEAKLHVDATSDNMAIFNSSSANSFILFSENNGTRGYIGSVFGTTEDFDIGTLGSPVSRMHLTTNAIPRLTVAGNGNVGIGTTSPAYKLDVAGRLRIQHTTNTAGIWLDGSTNAIRSFVGMADDNHVGLYGNGGSGWNFVMNVNDGNTGIGTSAPTAKLDVNGALRIRGGSPAAGSVLTSIDANGNTTWKPQKVAFSARLAKNVAMPDNVWKKMEFELEDFDASNSFLPFAGTTTASSAKFTAPVSGVYHFSAHGDMELFSWDGVIKSSGIALVVNGVQRFTSECFKPINDDGPISLSSNTISGTVHLNAGDQVWVEANQFNGEGIYCGFAQSQNASSFSGHLVYAD